MKHLADVELVNAAGHTATLSAANLNADRAIALPDAAGALALASTHSVTASNKSLAAGDFCAVTAAGLTLTLPASPSVDDTVYIHVRSFTNTVIARNGANIQGIAEDMTIDVANITVGLKYTNATDGWVLI